MRRSECTAKRTVALAAGLVGLVWALFGCGSVGTAATAVAYRHGNRSVGGN